MEGCLEAWKEVGLTALRSTLDEQALDIAQRRELSTKRRKELAQQRVVLAHWHSSVVRPARCVRLLTMYATRLVQRQVLCGWSRGWMLPRCKGAPSPPFALQSSFSSRLTTLPNSPFVAGITLGALTPNAHLYGLP